MIKAQSFRIIFSRRHLPLALGILAVFFMSFTPLQAGQALHKGYCDHVKSTAETLDCIRSHFQGSTETLDDLYVKLQNRAEPEENEEGPLGMSLEEIQRGWLDYRSAHCLWEAAQVDNPALARIYELSCRTRLNERRIRDFTRILEEEWSTRPREFSTSPRWLNALIADHQGIFWQLGMQKHIDLTCDGAEEVVVSGLRPETESGRDGKKPEVPALVLAVSSNPVTGRPKSHLIELPIYETEAAGKNTGMRVCDHYITKSTIPLPARKARKTMDEHDREDSGDGFVASPGEKQCGFALRIQDGVCADYILYYMNGTYELSQFPAQQSSRKDNSESDDETND